MTYDWVKLASAVLEEGVKALVPGGGVVVELVGTALEPEKARLRDWSVKKAQQKAFVESVQEFGRRNGFGDADVELGMAAAANVMRRFGASLDLIAELNLNPNLTAHRVLAKDPYSQQDLWPDARKVCRHAVEVFYTQFLRDNRPALDRAVQRVLLHRTDLLPERMAEAVWGAAPGISADLRLRLDRIRGDYGLVGGRHQELGDLDAFIAGRNPYLMLGGRAGMGKTALLVEWIRELEQKAAVTAVYHFISRHYGTASRLDLMTSLAAQAAAAWGQRLDSGTLASVGVLESEWQRLLGTEPPRPVVIIVDGVDEAEGRPVPPLLFPLEPPANVHFVISARDVTGQNWPATLGIQGAASATVGRLSPAGVAEILLVAGVPAWVHEERPLQTLVKRTDGDPFYLRLLIDAIQKDEVSSPEDLKRVPAGLDEYLATWWSELTDSVGDKAVQTLLGYLVAAVGPITRDELMAIDPNDALSGFTFDGALRRIGRFAVGDPERTGVALAHWRLQDFAARRLRGDLDAFLEALLAWCERWPEHHARYALAHLAGHLLRRAAGPQELGALGALLADEGFQKARVEEADDTVGLLDDLDRHLTRLAAHADATVALIRAALEVAAARDRWLQPEVIIELARQGRVGEAVRRLGRLDSQPVPQWHEAAQLVLAWTAADGFPDSACDLLDGLDGNALWGPGVVMHGRVLARLREVKEPELTMWFAPHRLPAASSRSKAMAGIERLGGAPAYERGISGLPHEFFGDNEAGIYLAEADAPEIVAYARDEPAEGDEWLSQYIDLHASNPYPLYRNRSLLSVLAAVCCLPDADQARRHAARLTAAALAPSRVQFVEFARLALVGWRARSSTEAARGFQALVASALQNAESLQSTREASDRWGHHARRLAAHAEVASLVLGDPAGAVDLIDRAMRVPFGYAGYRAPASIAVAESLAVVAPLDVARQEAALDSALTSAHNIQEPAFCALMTARVNTVIGWWRSPAKEDLAKVVESFVQAPGAARFSPRHRLGESFERRSRDDHLPVGHITALQSPREVAQSLGLPIPAVTRLTADADPDTVVLPDPGFAPMVAAYFAAQVAASALPREERVRLIAAVLPVASKDVTHLDRVLGRLLSVREDLGPEGPAVEALLNRQMTREPTGVWSAPP